MELPRQHHEILAQGLRDALEGHDLDALASLMSPVVTWGDVNDSRGCRDRSEVVATFARLRDAGVRARVNDVITGPRGVLVNLSVHWPVGADPSPTSTVHQVYMVNKGVIVEVVGFDDPVTALDAIGAPSFSTRRAKIPRPGEV